MEGGRWAEYTTNQLIELLSMETRDDFDSIWENLTQLKDEHQTEEKNVLTAPTISNHEQLLTAQLVLEDEQETGVVTAQLILSKEDLSLQSAI